MRNFCLSLNIEHISDNSKVRANALYEMSITINNNIINKFINI